MHETSYWVYECTSHYSTRTMTWIPESVSTISLNSFTLSANDASSKGFCIWPLPKYPRSPPRSAEPQSLSVLAISENKVNIAYKYISGKSLLVKLHKRISSHTLGPSECNFSTKDDLISLIWVTASSFDCTILGFLQLAGLLDLLCFFKIWRHLTWSADCSVGNSQVFSLLWTNKGV